MIEIKCRLITILALLCSSHCSSIYQRQGALVEGGIEVPIRPEDVTDGWHQDWMAKKNLPVQLPFTPTVYLPQIKINGEPDHHATNWPNEASAMNERSCYAMRGRFGSCMSLLSCYPTSMLARLSDLEVSTVMTRLACNYFEIDGTQTHGICCPIRQSFDEFGDLSHTGRLPFIPSIFVPSGLHYPTVAYPLMVLANETLRMLAQNPSSSRQLAKTVLTNTEISCGVGPANVPGLDSDRIVGGEEAVKNSWPGIVALKRSGRFTCGGFLIAPNKVLTAAHCVKYLLPWNVGLFTVELGVHVLFPVSDTLISRKLSRVERHKYYYTFKVSDDIAILTLHSPVTYRKEISPFCLPPADTTDDFAGQEAIIIGWGSMLNQFGPLPNALQQATVKIVSNDECQASYSNRNILIRKSIICAIAPGKGSCFGDSGGPLLVRSSPTAPWTVVGITSFGIECASPVYPTAYTRVSSYSNWISKRI